MNSEGIVTGAVTYDFSKPQLLDRGTHYLYDYWLKCRRDSGTEDYIHVIEPLSENEEVGPLVEGQIVTIKGDIRSYNNTRGLPKCVIYVCGKERHLRNEDHESIQWDNEFTLRGTICKRPIYRTTPKGKQITDSLLAVNLNFRKSAYIPVITWSQNAIELERYKVGEKVELQGRLQSRSYMKEGEERLAIEFSVSSLAQPGSAMESA